MDEQERGERKLHAYELKKLEEEGLEKMGEISLGADEELVLVGDQGPVPYENLLTDEEYRDFRELAENEDPSETEIARGHELLRLMMKRYPNGPPSK